MSEVAQLAVPDRYVEAALRAGLGKPDLLRRCVYEDRANLAVLVQVLRKNLILVRALGAMGAEKALPAELQSVLNEERLRVASGIHVARRLATALREKGLPCVFIKTLDNYPDMGHDIDVLVEGPQDVLHEVMTSVLGGKLKRRTLSEHLSNKWNYEFATYPTVEIHQGRLGQVGEEARIVRPFLQWAQEVRVNGGESLPVPAPEHRLVLAMLQRVFRHFNVRVCDVVNAHRMLVREDFDWPMLGELTFECGLAKGMRHYLALIATILEDRGERAEFLGRAESVYGGVPRPIRVWVERGYFRFSLWRVGPSAYTSKFLSCTRQLDLGATARLLLIPMLAGLTYVNLRFAPQWPVWKRIW